MSRQIGGHDSAFWDHLIPLLLGAPVGAALYRFGAQPGVYVGAGVMTSLLACATVDRRVRGEARRWEMGAEGERATGRALLWFKLRSLAQGRAVRVLHDVGVPGRRENIDHIVVSRSGLAIVDSKKYTRSDWTIYHGGRIDYWGNPLRVSTTKWEAEQLAETIEDSGYGWLPVHIVWSMTGSWRFVGVMSMDGVDVVARSKVGRLLRRRPALMTNGQVRDLARALRASLVSAA
jgi:hypothetical protein